MNKYLVSLVMGSDSDLPVVKGAVEVLDQFGVPYELQILSAHRSPRETHEFARNAVERGIKVIIVAAGGAAHLAGVIASEFSLPVIGIPIETPALGGVDSLYSIVQMPPGVPVATVGINAAKNAGLLAIEILAVSNPTILKKLLDFKKDQARTVIEKSKKLRKLGIENYLKQKGR